MTQTELINRFPAENSITDRVLLVPPQQFQELVGLAVHECRIFILVTAGTLSLKVGSRITQVTANQFIDMLAWNPVCIHSRSHDLNAWCLMPNYVFTTEALHGLKPADSESFKDRNSIPLLQLNHEECTVLQGQLQLLQHTLSSTGNFYRNELAQTYFRSFMLETGNIMQGKRKDNEDSERVENRQDTIMRSFLKLVWRYYTTQHNVEFYAGKLCLSSKHLSRVVRGKLGKTPYAVIRDELLQRASFLLTDTKMSVQEISAELHFSEMAAFCKFFKKHNGMSPTAFRAGKHSSQSSC